MDVSKFNRLAWDKQVEKANQWTVPVPTEKISAARLGDWDVVLTPTKPVPRSWFPDLAGLDLLCLASGGGQQAPIFAAAGARVTVFDNSPRQLAQDEMVARRDQLEIKCELGDMRDLSRFAPSTFDLVFNPCSVSFIPGVRTVFQEAHRVLRPGGLLMCGFVNPLRFIFDETKLESGHLEVRHALPYSDETHLSPGEKAKLEADGEPLMFSHSLEELIGGQISSGFVVRDFFEDISIDDPVCKFLPAYFATLSEKSSA